MQRFGSSFPLERFRARWPPRWKAEASARGIGKKTGLVELLEFLDTRFSAIVTGDEVAPEACIALEDSEAGILAASRAGMLALLVPDDARRPSATAMNAAFRVLPTLIEARDAIRDLIGRPAG